MSLFEIVVSTTVAAALCGACATTWTFSMRALAMNRDQWRVDDCANSGAELSLQKSGVNGNTLPGCSSSSMTLLNNAYGVQVLVTDEHNTQQLEVITHSPASTVIQIVYGNTPS